MYLHLFFSKKKKMDVWKTTLGDSCCVVWQGFYFLLVQPTRWAWFVVPVAVTWCILCFGKKQLQWIDLSTWFLLAVFKGTSHKVAKHWLKTEVVLFFFWTSVIYQLHVVFPGVQKGFWFHLYTYSSFHFFTFPLLDSGFALTVTRNKI